MEILDGACTLPTERDVHWQAYPFSKQQGPSLLTIRQDSVVRLYYIYEEVNGT